jgi:N-acetylmuramic acid 6-phosphate etherase
MVDVQPTNAKLRDRALRILQELTGASAEAAFEALVRSRWSVKKALLYLRKARLARRRA